MLAFTRSCQLLPVATSATGWDMYVNHFVEAYFAAHPSFAVYAGRHEFDGQLPDWSPTALNKESGSARSAGGHWPSMP